ncbi:unnamed protein product [Arabidopsis lyrata]|nr:unnamed protein product [Arabidopsis lyrata]
MFALLKPTFPTILFNATVPPPTTRLMQIKVHVLQNRFITKLVKDHH